MGLADNEATERTPGLKWRKRAGGESVPYWVAWPSAVKAGYQPKTVRLHGSAEEIAARCGILQAEMLQWLGNPDRQKIYDGSLKSLIELYSTDQFSPFQQLRPVTRHSYETQMRNLLRIGSSLYVEDLCGDDIKRWFRQMKEHRAIGYAALMISVLKAILAWGASKRLAGCLQLRLELRETRFETGERRQTVLSYAQVKAFRGAAHAMERPSMALGISLQYELALRQRDVIGEWVKVERQGPADGSISHGQWRWQDGLTAADIDARGVLRRTLSKTRKSSGARVEHQVEDYPELMAELAPVLASGRIGPLVIDESTGLPYTAKNYRIWFRRIARAASIPDEVWSMDARAGAVTEAYESGASTEGVMAIAGHTQVRTSRRYLRNTERQISSVAKLRQKNRE